jgi:hypothetical protein
MKKIVMAIVLGLVGTGMQANSTQVFLKNNYGAEIAYNLNGQKNLRIANGDKKLLGGVDAIRGLEVRTTGWGSSFSSPFSSLMYKVNEVQSSGIKALDAVLVIDPSDALSDWNINLVWEPTEDTRKKFDERPDWRMQLIEHGFLGSGLKQFASQICSANYAEVIKKNGTNLCQYMREEIKNISLRSLNSFLHSIKKQFDSMRSAGLIK